MLRFKEFVTKLEEASINPDNPLQVHGLDDKLHNDAMVLGGVGTHSHQASITRKLGSGHVGFQRLQGNKLLVKHGTNYYIAHHNPEERSGVSLTKANLEDMPKKIVAE